MKTIKGGIFKIKHNYPTTINKYTVRVMKNVFDGPYSGLRFTIPNFNYNIINNGLSYIDLIGKVENGKVRLFITTLGVNDFEKYFKDIIPYQVDEDEGGGYKFIVPKELFTKEIELLFQWERILKNEETIQSVTLLNRIKSYFKKQKDKLF